MVWMLVGKTGEKNSAILGEWKEEPSQEQLLEAAWKGWQPDPLKYTLGGAPPSYPYPHENYILLKETKRATVRLAWPETQKKEEFWPPNKPQTLLLDKIEKDNHESRNLRSTLQG